MKNVNQKRNYGLIKWGPTGAIGTATHEGVDRWIPNLGAIVRAGGETDLLKRYPQEKIDKNTARMLKKASRINRREGRAPAGQSH